MDHSVPTRRELLGVGVLAASALTAPELVSDASAQTKPASSGEKTQTKWSLSGDYFEACNCSVVCPCLFSPAAPATSRPTEGDCHVALLFHVDKGAYGDVKLDGLNAVVCLSSDGPIAHGNMIAAAYVDERADDKQTDALAAVFGGAAGGPMSIFAPLVGKSLGVKKAPIVFKIDGKVRSGQIPGVLSMSVRPLLSMVQGEEIWAAVGYPINPSKLALAVSDPGSTYTDYGLKWDNSGRNGFYAAINWSSA